MFGSNWQRLAQLHVDTLLACRSCSEQRHSMLGMRWTPTPRVATRMSAGTGAAPGQAPPDLPSLLLDGRICYIGMPVSVLDMLLACTHACATHLRLKQ